MTEIFEPKTVEEFINYYESELKKELGVYDIQINKIGFMGFLLNILGHTHYDIKNYYDFLFKESFIATANTSENIHLHASTYGYFPSFGVPAKINGSFEVNFKLLPAKQTSVVKRELYINNHNQLFKFESNGYEFATKAVYKMVFENEQYYTVVLTEEGKFVQYPASSFILTPPILDSAQYFQKELRFRAPLYEINTFHNYYFQIEDGYICDVFVYITKKDAVEEEEYEVKYVKYFETPSSKTVFLRKLNQTDYILELGSGKKGIWLPDADIRIVLNITKGESGNFLNSLSAKQKSPEQVVLVDTDDTNTVVSTIYLDAKQLVTLNIENSEEGKDPLNDLELRDDVIKYIQTRDNMISENDFYNIVDKYVSDFKFLFKKVQVYDNVFYLCRSLRNKYQIVLYSTNYTLPLSSFTTTFQPTFNIDGVDLISPFLYKYNSIMNYYDGYIMQDDLFVYVSSTELKSDDYTMVSIPPLHFNLKFDSILNQTSIQVKSFQDISEYEFYLTIPILDISNELLTNIDENTSELIYTLDDGVIYDEFDIQLDGFHSGTIIFTSIVESINQVYNITDLLNLTHYTWQGIDYIINVPVIEKEKFDSDKKYYIDKLNGFISIGNFTENRMISDSIQFRFLNTFKIDSPFFEASTIQDDTFLAKIEKWLDPVRSCENTTPTTHLNQYRFLVGTSPTGIFVGHKNEIAIWIEEKEETEIICNGADTLVGSEYFYLYSTTMNYYVWYNIDSSSIDPSTVGTGVEINITSTETAIDIADITAATINLLPEFSSDNILETINIINTFSGGVSNSIDFNTGFNFTTTNQGITGNYQFEVPEEFDGIYVLDPPERFCFNGLTWDLNTITLPLELSIELIIDQLYLTKHDVNLYEEKENLIFEVADLLQKNYTGSNIIFYNSQIVDFIHLNRSFIKSVKVQVTDKHGSIISNGIESREDRQILEQLKDNKFNIVRYTPIFWHWNVDNITVTTLIN